MGSALWLLVLAPSLFASQKVTTLRRTHPGLSPRKGHGALERVIILGVRIFRGHSAFTCTQGLRVHLLASMSFVGHPQARDTSQDGQYESCLREGVNLTPIPGRPARGESPDLTIDLGTVFFDDRSGNFWE